jgi:3-oxoacyl-[acyl-carrier-protein] synthase II
VLEARSHAAGRGRTPYAKLERVVSDRIRRSQGGLSDGIAALGRAVLGDRAAGMLAVSGASGAHAPTAAENEALDRLGLTVRGMSTMTGHLKEAQFPFAVALAALAVSRGEIYPPFDAAAEGAFEGTPSSAVATTVGYHQFEGMALVSGA